MFLLIKRKVIKKSLTLCLAMIFLKNMNIWIDGQTHNETTKYFIISLSLISFFFSYIFDFKKINFPRAG